MCVCVCVCVCVVYLFLLVDTCCFGTEEIESTVLSVDLAYLKQNQKMLK